MSELTGMSEQGDGVGPLPKEIAAIMRPEIPSLVEEIWAEIVRTVPAYARIFSGPNAELARVGLEQNLNTFVEQVAAPGSDTSLRDEMCRAFGRLEAEQGRSLDNLQETYRVGARLALRRARKVGRRFNLSPAVILAFADALFAYTGELSALSRSGYTAALAERDQHTDQRRRRLLALLLGGSANPSVPVAELGEQLGWPIPESVTPIAVGPAPSPAANRAAHPAPNSVTNPTAPAHAAALDPDVLAELEASEPRLLLPGAPTEARLAMLAAALPGRLLAVGLTVPPGEAPDSLRWARQALALARSGVIAPDGVFVPCEQHLVTLWLHSAPSLVDQLARRQLAPLAGLTALQRERLVETLRSWLTTRGSAGRIAEDLSVHPQTVRYRMRLLEQAFGDRLEDPDQQFATEVVLRARHRNGDPFT